MLAQTIGRAFAIARDGLARVLARAGCTPNDITTAGVLFNGAAGVFFAFGEPIIAAAMIICAGACDMLDGAVARIANRGTTFGQLYDSALDRFSDSFILLGILVHFHLLGSTLYVVLTGLAMMGSLIVSYTRARAECLIPSCKVGFWERGERIVLILVGALFGRMEITMWILAIGANWTALHRIVHSWREMKEPSKEPESEKAPDESKPKKESTLRIIWRAVEPVVFWRYGRGSVAYDVMVFVILAITFATPLNVAAPFGPIVRQIGPHAYLVTFPPEVIRREERDLPVRREALRRAMERVLKEHMEESPQTIEIFDIQHQLIGYYVLMGD